MDFAVDEPATILAKSLSLIEKLTDSLRRLDQWRFATSTSGLARELLLKTLAALANPKRLASIDSAVLYNRLFSLQELVEIVERSATHRISWPLVSYCDEIWTKLFGPDGPMIFYSLMPEHNYSIVSFSQLLASYLNGLLPRVTIDTLTGGKDIYCLQLASSEDENSPLYANIGHEFGHAVFDHREREIVSILDSRFSGVLPQLADELKRLDPAQAARLYSRMARVILKIAEELFCDSVGAALMGPAFLLSLFEISWGQNKNSWSMRLAPDDRFTSAYPSFNFRLDLIKNQKAMAEFISDAKRDFSRSFRDEFQRLHDCITTIPGDHSRDTVSVRPIGERDSDLIRLAWERVFPEIKIALSAFLLESRDALSHWYVLDEPCVSSSDVVELLKRLRADILPNVVPDDTLLGRPASFTAILNSSALFRAYTLASGRTISSEELSRKVRIVQRLTAKAFEVTFVQREYKRWEQASGNT